MRATADDVRARIEELRRKVALARDEANRVWPLSLPFTSELGGWNSKQFLATGILSPELARLCVSQEEISRM